jgi:hypothetical protein
MRPGLVHREGQGVRIAGWILLIAGALLCATLVWAAVGFLLMGVGLLSLLVAENNRKRANRPVVERAPPDMPIAAPPPIPEPVVHREAPKMISPRPRSYDRQAWRWLVEGDPDLAGVASVLADYGQQYVDELAEEYLTDTDKTRLPEIVDGIIARARRGVAPHGRAHPAVDARPPDPVGGPNAVAVRPDRQPRPSPEAKLKLSEKLSDSASSPAEPAKQEAVGAPAQAALAAEPLQSAEDRNARITSADEELTAMLGKLSPDSATPGKN